MSRNALLKAGAISELSIRLQTKWLWVRILLLSLQRIRKYLNTRKVKVLANAFSNTQFYCASMIWMFAEKHWYQKFKRYITEHCILAHHFQANSIWIKKRKCIFLQQDQLDTGLTIFYSAEVYQGILFTVRLRKVTLQKLLNQNLQKHFLHLYCVSINIRGVFRTQSALIALNLWQFLREATSWKLDWCWVPIWILLYE